MKEYSAEQVREIRNALPQGFLEQVVRDELAKRKPPERPTRAASPSRGYKAVMTGMHKRVARPQAAAEDRLFVPGALKHWRRVHGLSQRAAQEKIGLSPASCSWGHYESGFQAPSYRTLLKILASTGLGHWTDPDHQNGMDAELRLEMLRGRR